MSLIINTAIAALDKPTSLAPFFVKDSMDNIGRTVMAAKESGKHEARERFIEEFGTSAFWIGGIPAVRFISNKIFKNKIDTDIHFKRINTKGIQGYFANQIVDKNGKKKFSAKDLQGINLGGEHLGKIQDKLKNADFIPNKSTGKYGKYHIGVSAVAVGINFAMLSFVLPKLNQLLSKKIISKEIAEKNKLPQENSTDKVEFQKNNQKPSFKGIKDFFDFKNVLNFTRMAENAQLNPTSSMLILDYGISGSRVTYVPRNKEERIEYAVKEGGVIMFFYYAADWIKKGFETLANKVFKTPIDLDYRVINDNDFKSKMSSNVNKKELLSFTSDKADEVEIIKFIDKELKKAPKNIDKNNVFNNFTLKMAQKSGLVDVEYDNQLKSWIRHSKKYIETDKVLELNKNLKNFSQQACNSKSLTKEILTKTKAAKITSIFGNMALCCISLSYFLPKIQYKIREKMTNSKAAPGIEHYEKLAQANKL